MQNMRRSMWKICQNQVIPGHFERRLGAVLAQNKPQSAVFAPFSTISSHCGPFRANFDSLAVLNHFFFGTNQVDFLN